MAILGFEEKISGSVTLAWDVQAGDVHVRRLFIPKNPNYEQVKLVSLVLGNFNYAPNGAPLEFFSVEKGIDDCGPGQPIDRVTCLGIGQSIEMKLEVDPIFGEILLRGMFVVSDAWAFRFRRSSG